MSAAFSDKTDAQVAADRDDIEMMKRDHMWPHVILPLTRGAGDDMSRATVAVLLNPGPPWVLVENMSLFGPLGEISQVEYDSPEAIVAAGWRVD